MHVCRRRQSQGRATTCGAYPGVHIPQRTSRLVISKMDSNVPACEAPWAKRARLGVEALLPELTPLADITPANARVDLVAVVRIVLQQGSVSCHKNGAPVVANCEKFSSVTFIINAHAGRSMLPCNNTIIAAQHCSSVPLPRGRTAWTERQKGAASMRHTGGSPPVSPLVTNERRNAETRH